MILIFWSNFWSFCLLNLNSHLILKSLIFWYNFWYVAGDQNLDLFYHLISESNWTWVWHNFSHSLLCYFLQCVFLLLSFFIQQDYLNTDSQQRLQNILFKYFTLSLSPTCLGDFKYWICFIGYFMDLFYRVYHGFVLLGISWICFIGYFRNKFLFLMTRSSFKVVFGLETSLS